MCAPSWRRKPIVGASGAAEGRTEGRMVLVEAGSPQVQLAAVELDATEPVDAERADARVDRVALHLAPAVEERRAGRVEVRPVGPPQPRIADPRPCSERCPAAPGTRCAPKRSACRRSADDPGRAGRWLLTLATSHVDEDARGAAAAAKARPHVDVLEVEVRHLAQVDLAQDAGVVPPAALERTALPIRERRDVELLAPAVGAHDEPVDAAPPDALRTHLERQVRADVAPIGLPFSHTFAR